MVVSTHLDYRFSSEVNLLIALSQLVWLSSWSGFGGHDMNYFQMKPKQKTPKCAPTTNGHSNHRSRLDLVQKYSLKDATSGAIT